MKVTSADLAISSLKKSLGVLIKAKRKKMGMVQRDVASRLNRSQVWISTLERGEGSLDGYLIMVWFLHIGRAKVYKALDDCGGFK